MKTLGYLLLLLMSMGLLNKFLLKDYIYHAENFKIKEKLLLMGDSHAQYALDDKLINGALNLSYRSEKYIWSYYKLKKIVKANSQIEKVFLTFSYHSLGRHNEKDLAGVENRSFFYNRYFPLLDNEGISDLESLGPMNYDLMLFRLKYQLGMPFEVIRDWKMIPKIALGQVGINDFSFGGYYQKDEENSLGQKSFHSVVKRHFSSDFKESNIQKKYLKKIQSLCEEKGIEFVVVTTPIHPEYFQHIPAIVKKSYWRERERLKKENVLVVDFSFLDLKDEDFKDFDHLNTKGAQKFSFLINKFVR